MFYSPDVLIRGEQDDRSGVASVQQQADDFIEVGGFVVVRDLQRLSDTDSTCRDTEQTGTLTHRPAQSISC